MEALFLTCLINAPEHQKVATVDIPGAFIQADMEGKTVHMKLEGKMAELLTKLDPKLYQKYATNEKGRTVLYVYLKKDLSGKIQAALLFLRNLTSGLQEWGFEINPPDWCVANKTVDGKKNDSHTACGQPGDLPQTWRHSGRLNQQTQKAIWKGVRLNNTTSKGALVSGDESGLPRSG